MFLVFKLCFLQCLNLSPAPKIPTTKIKEPKPTLKPIFIGPDKSASRGEEKVATMQLSGGNGNGVHCWGCNVCATVGWKSGSGHDVALLGAVAGREDIN